MDHYYYFLKVLKNVLYNAQNDQQTALMASDLPKPLAGIFQHLVWPKNEEDRLPGSLLFKLVVSASTNCTLVHST
jgi:hypothetical protein